MSWCSLQILQRMEKNPVWQHQTLSYAVKLQEEARKVKFILVHLKASARGLTFSREPEVSWLMPFSPVTPVHSPCRAPEELLPALGMHQGKMDQEDGRETRWAAQRLQPKILPSFVTNICGSQLETLQNTRAHTAGNNCRAHGLFIYLLPFINWKWNCFCTF